MAKSGASKGAKNIDAFRDGDLSYYSIEDKKNVINYHKKIDSDPTYKMKDFERDSIMRQYGRKV